MLNLPRDGGTKTPLKAGTFAQQQTEGVGIAADKPINVETDARMTLPPATLPRLTHQLTQHQTAFIHHRQTELIDIAKMTVKRRWRTRFTRHLTQTQLAKLRSAPSWLNAASTSERRVFSLLRSNTHHNV